MQAKFYIFYALVCLLRCLTGDVAQLIQSVVRIIIRIIRMNIALTALSLIVANILRIARIRAAKAPDTSRLKKRRSLVTHIVWPENSVKPIPTVPYHVELGNAHIEIGMEHIRNPSGGVPSLRQAGFPFRSSMNG